MSVTIWHNPRCSKSRQTLALLEARGISPLVRLYLEDVPVADEISAVAHKLGLSSVREMMRTKETEYRAQALKDVTDETALIEAMVNTPKLIERPVVLANGKAAMGRPPEAVLEIL